MERSIDIFYSVVKVAVEWPDLNSVNSIEITSPSEP